MSIEKIKYFETKYEVETIRANGHQVWPLIRYSLWAFYSSEVSPISVGFFGFTRIIELVKQFFYGFISFFGRYNYLGFSDSSERKLINDKWVDKSVDFILESLPRSLLFEIPLPRHYPTTKIPTLHIASKLPLYALERMYTIFNLKSTKIENEHIIKQLLDEMGVDFDYLKVIKRNTAQYKVGKLIWRLYKPKGVIIQCAYTNTGFVKAFKDNGVKVIEVQHGLISSGHVAYNIFKKLDNSYFPDYFLSYGDQEIGIFKNENFYIPADRVIPAGHYYLEIIRKSKRTLKEYLPEASGYRYCVSVTGQLLPHIELRFIKFIIEVAKQISETCFIYIPRNLSSDIYKADRLPSNLIIASDRDTYEIIRLTSCHTTMYSTCAIEALALGTPNILVNIDNLAQVHLGETLCSRKSTIFVDTVEEYIEALNRVKGCRKEEIVKLNSDLISPHYQNNVRESLKTIFTT
ncbi:hypothetical protein MASR2M41_24430 [Flammeovirgaceae bacterium]